MLTLKYITENTEDAIRRLAKKHFDGNDLIRKVVYLDSQRKASQAKLDETLSQIKKISSEVGGLFKAGKAAEAEILKQQVAALKDKSKELADVMESAAKEITEILLTVPNVPNETVPEGYGAQDNKVERMGGPNPELPDNALPHWELAKQYGIIDFETGVKITGAGFPVYVGQGARLQRALINFFLDEARKAGYTEIMPPTVVNAASGYGTGQLPDKEGQMYHCEHIPR